MPDLLYGTKKMGREPVNMTLSEVARRVLHHESPTVVVLEPGDMTRYRILLVSCGAAHARPHLGSFGIPAAVAHEWLCVVSLDGRGCGMAFVPWGGRTIHEAHVDGLERNAWSRRLIAWWLDELRQAVEAADRD